MKNTQCRFYGFQRRNRTLEKGLNNHLRLSDNLSGIELVDLDVSKKVRFETRKIKNKLVETLHHFTKNPNKVEYNIKPEKGNSLQGFQTQPSKPLFEKKNSCIFNETQDQSRCLTSMKISHRRYNTLGSEVIENTKISRINVNLPSSTIPRNKIYCRYQILDLHSLYQSLLKFSQRKPKKFLHAFESALNSRKIMLKPEIIKKHLYQQKKMEFHNFLQVYKKMEDLMYMQGLIDYLHIIFETYIEQKMSFNLVLHVLAKRSRYDLAKEITEEIFEKLKVNQNDGLFVNQIVGLCQRDFDFCSSFSRIYQNQSY